MSFLTNTLVQFTKYKPQKWIHLWISLKKVSLPKFLASFSNLSNFHQFSLAHHQCKGTEKSFIHPLPLPIQAWKMFRWALHPLSDLHQSSCQLHKKAQRKTAGDLSFQNKQHSQSHPIIFSLPQRCPPLFQGSYFNEMALCC